MSEIVVRPRKSGKTTAAVEWFLQDPQNRVIAVPNVQRIREVWLCLRWHAPDVARTLDFSRCVVVAEPEKIRGLRQEVWVDDADYVLEQLLGRQIQGAGWNQE